MYKEKKHKGIKGKTNKEDVAEAKKKFKKKDKKKEGEKNIKNGIVRGDGDRWRDKDRTGDDEQENRRRKMREEGER